MYACCHHKKRTVSLTMLYGQISEINCRDFVKVLLLFYFVAVVVSFFLFLYIMPKVVMSYRESCRKVARKCSQGNILKNRMVKNIEY